MGKEPFIDFLGKRVLVTGASSGIGQTIAIELSRRGASVILTGRDEGRLNETLLALTQGNHQTCQMNLNSHSEILSKIKEISNKNEKIYGLCHSAGVVETRPLGSCKTELVQKMLSTTLLAGIELARAVARRDVMEDSGGSILFISSIDSLVGRSGQIGYSASKGAVTAMARSMAIELSRRKIRVNSLSPGLVRTAMTEKALSRLSEDQIIQLEDSFPLGTGTPEDVARAAVFLLAPENKWITGSNMIVDGGFTAQ